MRRELRIFSKRRIANVIAGSVIIWTMLIWTQIVGSMMDGSFSQNTDNELLLTMVGILNGVCGYAIKHLFDSCHE